MCAGCNTYEPWAALLIGIMAGFVFVAIHILMLKFKLDDPLDAVGVHFGGGCLGVLAVPFFKQGEGIFWIGNQVDPWYSLAHNITGLICIILWSAFWSGLIFGGLKYFKQLRIPPDTEFKGCDSVRYHDCFVNVKAKPSIWITGQTRRVCLSCGLLD